MIFLIPARAGSKRIKNKNILKFKKKSLLDFTFCLFRNSKLKENLYVSTNSKKIIETCKKNKVNYVLRPNILSQDKSLVEEAILHFFEKKKNLIKNDWLILLQITSPLRNKNIFNKFLRYVKSQKKNINTVISVTKSKKDIWTEKNNKLIRIKPLAPRREQEREPYFEENGLFYAIRINYFLKHKKIIKGNIKKFITPKEISLDINDDHDLNLFKLIINKNKLLN